MMRAKIDFIHNYPVERGYVDEPEHWRYSSARNYAGLGGLIDVRQEWHVRTHAREGVLGTRLHCGAGHDTETRTPVVGWHVSPYYLVSPRCPLVGPSALDPRNKGYSTDESR
jgi:hypothetical protein